MEKQNTYDIQLINITKEEYVYAKDNNSLFINYMPKLGPSDSIIVNNKKPFTEEGFKLSGMFFQTVDYKTIFID